MISDRLQEILFGFETRLRELEMKNEPVKKSRGRPKGSKNKKKGGTE